MRQFILASLLAFSAFALFGCSGDLSKQIVGKYKMELDTTNLKEEQKGMAEMAKSFMGNMTLEIHEDKKATIDLGFAKEDGTWELEGNKLKISSKMQVDKPMVLVVSDNGNTLTPEMTEEEKKQMEGLQFKYVKTTDSK